MRTRIRTTRSENIDLMRALHGGNNRLAEILAEMRLPNYVSDWALGKRVLPDSYARAIEQKVGYPERWIDRDNERVLKASREDFELLTLVLDAPPEVKAALRTLLEKLTRSKPLSHEAVPLRLIK